jgi:molybdopterin-guanine dinucleotide biosynthesis protein A
MPPAPVVIGVLLAGGRGRRMGGDKARVALAGRPLAQWALDALAAAIDEVVVACRLDTELPALRGVSEAWVEPQGARGPVTGLVSALREARGRPVVACSISLPLVTPEVIRALAAARDTGRPVVVPEVGGRLEGLVARWEPSALPILAGMPSDLSLGAAARALDAAVIPFAGGDVSFTRVDAPEDLLLAASHLEARRREAGSPV